MPNHPGDRPVATTRPKAKPAGKRSRDPWGKNVLVEFEEGIAWVIFNRPEKRNAISADLALEMVEVFDALEADERAGVLVFTGAGDAWSAGMDLRDYFRATDNASPAVRGRVYRANWAWQWRRLLHYPKPTIAMVNGWCFGGAFTPLVACDLAIADEKAIFGLSEINWGIIPAGVVCKAVSQMMNRRDALYHVMTGETFTGKKAAEMGLVNEAVPKAKLRKRTVELAKKLLEKNPTVLRQAKVAFKFSSDMTWEEAADYLIAKSDQAQFLDPERGREQGMKQFLDDKSYKPGLQAYKRKR
ncbi:MAG: p-hydroxycinnamoyl CoA hydratase/lyase [Betaproteobacteria bacterium]|nr:p-hydroxycinnamoyl CoA hydratase/lyase [Betaproteobacteria bacterium]